MRRQSDSEIERPTDDAVNALWRARKELCHPFYGVELFVHDGLGIAADRQVNWAALSNAEKLRLRKHYSRLPGATFDDVRPTQPDALVPSVIHYLRYLPEHMHRSDGGYSAETIERCIGFAQQTEALRHKLECALREGEVFAVNRDGSPASLLVVKRVEDFPESRDRFGSAAETTIRRWENRLLAAALATPVHERQEQGRIVMGGLRTMAKQLWQIEELTDAALTQMVTDYDGRRPLSQSAQHFLAASLPKAHKAMRTHVYHIGFGPAQEAWGTMGDPLTSKRSSQWWQHWSSVYETYLHTCPLSEQELRIPRMVALNAQQMHACSQLEQARFRYLVFGAIRQMSAAQQVYFQQVEEQYHPEYCWQYRSAYRDIGALQQQALKDIASAHHTLNMPTGWHIERVVTRQLDQQIPALLNALLASGHEEFFAGYGLQPDGPANGRDTHAR